MSLTQIEMFRLIGSYFVCRCRAKTRAWKRLRHVLGSNEFPYAKTLAPTRAPFSDFCAALRFPSGCGDHLGRGSAEGEWLAGNGGMPHRPRRFSGLGRTAGIESVGEVDFRAAERWPSDASDFRR